MKRAALFLLLLAPAGANAAFSRSSRGTTAAPFLTLGAGARAAGMGGAQTAATEGAFSLGWNPAGIAMRRSYQLDVMHADWLQSANYNMAAAVLPVSGASALGVGFQQYSAGDLTRRDNNGFEDGSFTPQDMAATLAWASHTEDQVTWGVAGKFIQSKIQDSAATGAVDVGLITDETNGHRFGAAMTNLGGKLKYEAGRDPLPFLVAVGATQRFHQTLLAADLKFPKDNDPYAALGLEQTLPLLENWQGQLRLGYSTRAGTDSGGMTGASAGMGISSNWFSLDYALAPFGDLGLVHQFSLSIRGGGNPQS